ncbi:MAG: ParB/RepB/Spo0J family partition protein [Magnetospirillum sp.]|nr:ParB/RepB/Spo0J family partition protein [Magnetospirillum sp.]
MELRHIPLSELSVSALNMRHGRHAPDVSDILPSIRARGILQPLLVRPNHDGFEVVAGRRRYFAARALVEEGAEVEPLPCAVMGPSDDAEALEASLIENIARLDPDEMAQHETFARLIKEGRSIEQIAATFGITEIMVRRRLALGNLLPSLRSLYRKGEIDAETVRHLTMASKVQQKEWHRLHTDKEAHAPRGFQLKQWLFGGNTLSTKVALFPLEDYTGQIVADLFGEDAYFADIDQFWTLQNRAVAAKRDDLLAAGWPVVEVLETGQRFHEWDYEKTPKKKGGKVFVTISQRGEVEVFEGWLSRKEAKRRGRANGTETGGNEGEKPARPEVTKALQTYLDLHRHAAVRAVLLDHPGVALRLLLAHAIAGSRLWQVHPEPQDAGSEAIAASLASSSAQAAFAARRAEMLAVLGMPEDRTTVVHANGDGFGAADVFARLLVLPEAEVTAVLALVMGETLEAGSALVEAAGVHLTVDMRAHWQPDDTFFELMRDKPVINAMLAEVAGKMVADGNLTEKTATQKAIIRDCLIGANGRARVENWLPGWMAFPARAYTERGGVRAAEHWAAIGGLFATE